jgi:hypothetical protein
METDKEWAATTTATDFVRPGLAATSVGAATLRQVNTIAIPSATTVTTAQAALAVSLGMMFVTAFRT